MTNISIVSACNNHCKYCFQQDSYHKKNLMLTYEDVLDVFNWMINKSRVGIFGGEPTLHPDIVKILAEASKKFQTVLIMTNLTCDKAILEDIVKHVPDIKMLINTTTTEKYLDVFERNVEYLYAIKKNNISMGLTFVNEEEFDSKNIDKIVRLGRQFSGLFHYYRISVAAPYHRNEVNLNSYEKPILEFVKKVKEQTPDIIPTFDCFINNCQVPAKLMGALIDDYKVESLKMSVACAPQMDLQADKSVKCCSSLPDGFLEARHYRDFPSDVALFEYFRAKMQEYLVQNFKICKNFKECKNDICMGPCVALTEHLKRSLVRS